MPLQTTTIGAFPKPDYVPIRDWFQVDLGASDYPAEVVARWTDDPKYEADFERATRAAVADQLAAGIDIPTDGEQRRENYVHYQCRHFTGFDFQNLERRVLRNGAYDCELPAIRGAVRPGTPVMVRDFTQAQAASDKPIKITLPGPMTIIDSTADRHYGDARRLAYDLADALNTEVRALAEAGCQHIQIDEPVFARKPDAALEYGTEALARCFHGASGFARTVHMCCGYPDRLDNPDYPNADNACYLDLVRALDPMVDAISIEDCHAHNDDALFAQFDHAKAIVGFVHIATSRVEPVEEIANRMRHVLKTLPANRVLAAPDCGLGFLGRDLAMQKLTNLARAAALV